MSTDPQSDALRRTYRGMTDEQLAELSLDADQLSEAAFNFLRDEVRTRGVRTINILADAIERRRFRDYCTSISDIELQIVAKDGTYPEEWQREELNRQLISRRLEAVAAPDEVENDPSVAEQDAARAMDRGPLVSVGEYRDLPDAQLAQSVLDSAGIPTLLINDNPVRAYWLWTNLLGGLKLQVRASDAEAAEALLKDYSQELTEDFEEAHNEGSDGL